VPPRPPNLYVNLSSQRLPYEINHLQCVHTVWELLGRDGGFDPPSLSSTPSLIYHLSWGQKIRNVDGAICYL